MLLPLLVLLSVVLVGEALPAEPLRLPISSSLATLLLVVGVALFPHVLISQLMTRRREGRPSVQRWLSWVERGTPYGWAAGAIAMAAFCQWPRVVRFNFGLSDWLFVDDLLCLLPVLAPLPVCWAAGWRIQQTRPGATGKLGEFLSLRGRQHLVLSLLPVAAILAMHDVGRWLAKWDPQSGWERILPAVVFVGLAGLLPAVVRRMWPSDSLSSGPLRTRLQEVNRRVGLKIRDILVWNTKGQVANAAVTGWFARFRYVFLSDELLERLNVHEVTAVMLHEAAHIRRGHLLLRLLILLIPGTWWLVYRVRFPGSAEAVETALASSPWLGLAVAAGLAGYAAVALGAYSRFLELDADLWAVRHFAGDGSAQVKAESDEWPGSHLIRALWKLGCDDPRRASWLHPSLQTRAERLQAVAAEPAMADVYRRRADALALLLMAAWIMPPILLTLL